MAKKTKSKILSEFVTDIRDLQEKLDKYCHHKDCEYSGDCPELHTKCKKLLGAHTAVAWEAGTYIHNLTREINDIISCTSLCYDNLYPIIYRYSYRITALCNVAFYHRHKRGKLGELYSLIVKTRSAINYLYDDLQVKNFIKKKRK